jgi:cobalt/nickel transport protein
MKIITKFWVGLGVLAVLSPLGLLLPAYFKSGTAWGEWGSSEIRELVGYIPKGLEKLSSFWSAPIPDYALKGWGEESMVSLSLSYIFSAVIGMLICVGVVLILGKFLSKKQ